MGLLPRAINGKIKPKLIKAIKESTSDNLPCLGFKKKSEINPAINKNNDSSRNHPAHLDLIPGLPNHNRSVSLPAQNPELIPGFLEIKQQIRESVEITKRTTGQTGLPSTGPNFIPNIKTQLEGTVNSTHDGEDFCPFLVILLKPTLAVVDNPPLYKPV